MPYWSIPYGRINLPSSLLGVGIVVVFTLALLSRAVVGTNFAATWLLVGSAVPAAVIARIFYDVSAAPTNHDLWPFEVLISAFVGYIVALAATALGSLLKHSIGRDA